MRAFECRGDEGAQVRGEGCDVANSARTRALWGAEGFAHEEGGVGFAVLAGFGFLDKHELHNFSIKSSTACRAFLLPKNQRQTFALP